MLESGKFKEAALESQIIIKKAKDYNKSAVQNLIQAHIVEIVAILVLFVLLILLVLFLRKNKPKEETIQKKEDIDLENKVLKKEQEIEKIIKEMKEKLNE